MTICDTYIGVLDSPGFSWDDGDWSGNAPAALSPLFPPEENHYHGDFHAWVKATGIECRQTDYGCWVARVTKAQLREYLAAVYGPTRDLPWVGNRLQAVEAFVGGLDDDRVYALVATEW